MVLATSADAGLIETVRYVLSSIYLYNVYIYFLTSFCSLIRFSIVKVHDAASIDGLKKALGVTTLREYFLQAYGNPDGPVYKKYSLSRLLFYVPMIIC